MKQQQQQQRQHQQQQQHQQHRQRQRQPPTLGLFQATAAVALALACAVSGLSTDSSSLDEVIIREQRQRSDRLATTMGVTVGTGTTTTPDAGQHHPEHLLQQEEAGGGGALATRGKEMLVTTLSSVADGLQQADLPPQVTTVLWDEVSGSRREDVHYSNNTNNDNDDDNDNNNNGNNNKNQEENLSTVVFQPANYGEVTATPLSTPLVPVTTEHHEEDTNGIRDDDTRGEIGHEGNTLEDNGEGNESTMQDNDNAGQANNEVQTDYLPSASISSVNVDLFPISRSTIWSEVVDESTTTSPTLLETASTGALSSETTASLSSTAVMKASENVPAASTTTSTLSILPAANEFHKWGGNFTGKPKSKSDSSPAAIADVTSRPNSRIAYVTNVTLVVDPSVRKARSCCGHALRSTRTTEVVFTLRSGEVRMWTCPSCRKLRVSVIVCTVPKRRYEVGQRVFFASDWLCRSPHGLIESNSSHSLTINCHVIKTWGDVNVCLSTKRCNVTVTLNTATSGVRQESLAALRRLRRAPFHPSLATCVLLLAGCLFGIVFTLVYYIWRETRTHPWRPPCDDELYGSCAGDHRRERRPDVVDNTYEDLDDRKL